MAKGEPENSRHSSLGLASRHALDATRIDEHGRKALHRFSASYNVAPEHLKRVRSSGVALEFGVSFDVPRAEGAF